MKERTTWSAAELTSTLAGLMSLWMRPRSYNRQSAADKATARRRNVRISIERTDKSVKRLAPQVLRHEFGLPALAHELQRSCRPPIIEVVPQSAAPSTCTVQAPHSAWPQPNLVPVMPSTSRSAHSSGVSPSTSTSWGVPLIFNVKAMHAPLWLGLIGRSRP